MGRGACSCSPDHFPHTPLIAPNQLIYLMNCKWSEFDPSQSSPALLGLMKFFRFSCPLKPFIWRKMPIQMFSSLFHGLFSITKSSVIHHSCFPIFLSDPALQVTSDKLWMLDRFKKLTFPSFRISKQPPDALSGGHIPEWDFFPCPVPPAKSFGSLKQLLWH